MAQVDFYILNTDSPASRREFVARLLSTIQRHRKTAWVAVSDTEEAQLLDRLLWEYPPESFLPHAIASAEATGTHDEVSVLISAQAQAQPLPDVYINLRNELPPQHHALQRLVEVVIHEPSVLAATRHNYRFYREQGYEIKDHNMRR